MAPRPLDTIIELQDALDCLHRAEAQLAGIPDWMQELDAEYQERKGEIESLERQAEEATTARRTAEAGISDAQDKLKRYQQQINEVTNQREYGALLQEIDTVKNQITSLEEQAFASMEQADAANQALEEQRQAFDGLDQRYQAELAKWEKQKPGISEEAHKLREQVDVLRERLPRGHLRQFERILERTGGQALAAIRRVDRPRSATMWHCAVCNYNVRPQVLVDIQDRGSLIQCDSCKRILFVEPAEEAASVGGS
jgi:predicted  nucleic acid-binding Zn-ribbon protein